MTAALIPRRPAPAPVPRRRQLLLGTALASSGVGIYLLTLLGWYLSVRHANVSSWFKGTNPVTIPLTQPNMQFGTLILSSVMVQWAAYSIARNLRSHTYLALGTTLLLGLAFVNQTLFLFKQVGLAMDTQEGPLFYALCGSHLAFVCIGLVAVLLMTFRAVGGQFSARYPDGISAVAMYWHTLVGLYGVIWLAVYIMK